METPSEQPGGTPQAPPRYAVSAPQPTYAPNYAQATGAPPPQYPPAAAPPYYAPPAPAARPSRAGWVALGIVLAVLALGLGSCVAFFAAVGSAGRSVGRVGNAVALIHINATIQDNGGSASGVTPERIIGLLRKAEKDPTIRSVLLRVNSPGGTVSASQEIAMEVARMTKPTIADIGDTGASGAYYIASQCDTIVATPSSAVGSIGVIEEIPNIAELMKKLGVNVTVVHEGTFKDAGSPFRSVTATEKAMLLQDMKPAYDEFIAAVAKGRKMPESKVREIATGWLWPGVTAKDMGLVDVLGNYADAVGIAGRAGGLGSEPQVVDYDATDVFGALSRLAGAVERLGAPNALGGVSGQSVPR